jgi:hypothetical protein
MADYWSCHKAKRPDLEIHPRPIAILLEYLLLLLVGCRRGRSRYCWNKQHSLSLLGDYKKRRNHWLFQAIRA